MKQVIQDLYGGDAWILLGVHLPLFVFAWIGCWIATMWVKRPSKFSRTLARGMLGGAIGGFLNPLLFLMYVNALTPGPYKNRMQALEALPLLLAEGAILSLPLAVLIARRKQRDSSIKLHPPA
jgi:hypothetical protein